MDEPVQSNNYEQQNPIRGAAIYKCAPQNSMGAGAADAQIVCIWRTIEAGG